MKVKVDLGAVAYEAYGNTTEWKNFQGNPMPRWEELPPTIREAWRAAADAVKMLTEAAWT